MSFNIITEQGRAQVRKIVLAGLELGLLRRRHDGPHRAGHRRDHLPVASTMSFNIITEQGRAQVRKIVLAGLELGLLSRAEMAKRKYTGPKRQSDLGITVRYRDDKAGYMRQWRQKRRDQGLKA